MKLFGDIPVCGDPIDQGALKQIQRTRAVCDRAALMADHHKGYGVPIGGVMACREHISPTAVGYDIACGNKAVLTDALASDVKSGIGRIMDDIAKQISFGLGRISGWDIDHPMFDSPLWADMEALQQTGKGGRPLKDAARRQLGTVGSGNHYVDLFVDEQERVWIGVHFGSRGLGHKIATFFLEAANAGKGMEADPALLSISSSIGEDYLQCMELAGQYAYAGRDAVCSKVLEILGARSVQEVHNHHNFAWRETHGGVDYWVMRKGATPAFPGQKGFVGGSMGDNSVILQGVESKESKELLYSTVHGAGRVMSRTKAHGKNYKGKQMFKPGISREEMMAWVRRSGVELRGADVDEAPQAYKRLHEVLPAQGPTIKVLHTLRPIGVAMAGSDVEDPYKD
ncbi:MAG: RtcB family protein [Armatimonadetes bacterium]|nr:RtcB family protein [Armatimonadota bacterium]